jgi:hypothetical protein
MLTLHGVRRIDRELLGQQALCEETVDVPDPTHASYIDISFQISGR